MFQRKENNTYENNIKHSLKMIEQGLENINSNEEWLKLLSFQTKFHNYSFNNLILIYLQKPEATYVCGYNQWRNFDRYVKKGETGIKILAPLKCKIEAHQDEVTVEKYVLKGFRLVTVFDIAQTDGSDEKLPIVITGLKGNTEELRDIYLSLTERFLVEIQERSGMRVKGSYDLIKKVITIKAGLSYHQKIKTLIHEFAHHLHHTTFFNEESRDLSEVIAESIAFVVCNYLGIDCKDYSIPYIKTWCRDTNQLKIVGDTIQKISNKIITLISEKPLDTAKAAEQEAS